MILVIVAFIVLFIVIMGILIFFNLCTDDIVPAAICVIIFIFICMFIFIKSNDKIIKIYFDKKEIISLSNETKFKGNFVLGIGTIDNDDCYIIMVKENYGYIRKYIKVEDVYIQESDLEKPGIKTEMVEVYNKVLKKYETKINYNNPDLLFKTIIVVPKGTIKQNFKIED